jgi:hypothetical protein
MTADTLIIDQAAKRDNCRRADGLPWVDLLTSNPGAAYGQVVTVEVLQ